MKKNRLYIFTFLSLLVIVYVTGYLSMEYLVGLSTEKFMNAQIESSRREAKEIGNLVSYQVENKVAREVIINDIQQSIEQTDMQSGFICMYDRSGKQVCHPNPNRVGKVAHPHESYVSRLEDEISSKDFLTYLENKAEGGGVRDFSDPNRDSEIIYLFPVKNTDWIIASHANLTRIYEEVENLKVDFMLVYLTTGTLIVLLSFFMIRLIGNSYESRLEQKNEHLSKEVLNLSKLNHDLSNYKARLESGEKIKDSDLPENTAGKKRILTHLKNELITLEVEQIAYIYTEHTITYLRATDGKTSNSNSSLEDLYNGLDGTVFFRANRQFILSINSIDKILKYGNNQLKIEVVPKSPIDIIISKNKAAEFKKWLNK